MAKSTNFFGLRRGSTKSHTYQVYRGAQITKDRVTDIANPQSLAQMQQRLKVPLVASARAALKSLVNHSFEGTAYGEESLKLFSRLNLAKGALTVSEYVPKGAMDCGVADFQVSRGSLTPYYVEPSGANDKAIIVQSRREEGAATPPTISEETKLSNNAEALAAISTFFGLATGEQATILLLIKGDSYTFASGAETENEGHYHTFLISRLVNDITKVSNWTVERMAETTFVINDGYIEISGSTTSDNITIRNIYKDKNDVEAGTVIYSSESEGVWKRSTQKLEVRESSDQTQSFDECLYSYLKAGTVSDRYLNTGTVGVDITGGSTSTTTEG